MSLHHLTSIRNAENSFRDGFTILDKCQQFGKNKSTMGEEREEDQQTPFLTHSSTASNGYDGHRKRTGTLWTAVAHIITAVIGSGVLSLAWGVAQLGWIAGPVALVAFAAITQVSSSLLCDCYRSPDPETGHVRNQTYMNAVRFYLGERSLWVCGLFQQVGLYGTGIAYTITSANSLRFPSCPSSGSHFVDAFTKNQATLLTINKLREGKRFIPQLFSLPYIYFSITSSQIYNESC